MMVRAKFAMMMSAILMLAGETARAEVFYAGSFSGTLSETSTVAMPGFPEETTSYFGPGSASFSFYLDQFGGELMGGTINVGGVSGYYQRGFSFEMNFSYVDSAPGQGGDSLSFSFANAGTSYGYSVSITFDDPTGSFFETGVLGYGGTASASGGSWSGEEPMITTSAILYASRVVPEPSSASLSAVAGVFGLCVAAGRRRFSMG